YQYLTNPEVEWSVERIEQIQILKRIAYKLIDFVSQFEDELVKIWNKPKFVKNSNYVITLDRIAKKNGWHIIEKLQKHSGWQEQVREWIELGMIESEPDRLIEEKLTGKELNKKYQFLPIDTRYFKDLEIEILELFDNLDEELDGWLIKSENYQALNTILPKFKGKIKAIYIDPPYNTGSDEFIYEDRFRNSTWLTTMENRLTLAKEFLSEDGVIFVSIGDTIKNNNKTITTSLLQLLMSTIFEENNYLSTFIRKSGISPRQDSKYIALSHDYIICYAKNIEKVVLMKKEAQSNNFVFEDEFVEQRGKFRLNKLDRGSKNYSPSLDYPIEIKKGTVIEIFNGISFEKCPAPEDIKIYPGGNPEDKRWIWTWSKEKVLWGITEGYIVFRKSDKGWIVYQKEYEFVDNKGRFRKRKVPYDTLLVEGFYNESASRELYKIFGIRAFDYAKPTSLIKHLFELTGHEEGIFLDFFAGSGATAQAIVELNDVDKKKRKYLLVEMGEHFYNVIIPRMKKISYSKEWKNGLPVGKEGYGGFFVYFELEQFEDVLSNVSYNNEDPLFYSKPFNQYVFEKDEKLLRSIELVNPNEVNFNISNIYPNVDIYLSLSLVYNKWIKRVTKDVITLADGTDLKKYCSLKYLKPFIWW
ncbi:MAG: site-specific DNA-methyltransferase, partial [Candidatus Calescibacterium sp.]|nr:site-specific DNA-methyltransferase [Candidatus Calescibacterium sp.]